MRNTVHWFRTKGLRLHDNPSLLESIDQAETLRCVFILDPYFAQFANSNTGVNKWRFLLQCLSDLDQSLKKFNSRLFVIRGQPADVLPKLFKEWRTSCLSFEEDPEPFGCVRDQNIIMQCQQLGIEVIFRPSHTLYSSEMILRVNGGNPPLTYRQFIDMIQTLPPPPLPYGCPNNLPLTPMEPQFKEKFGIPTLKELGFTGERPDQILWTGGESEALRRLEKHLGRKAYIAGIYEETEQKPKLTSGTLFASETGISPYLRFGCLSTRLFYYQLTELYRNIKKLDPPLSLYAQIHWREFFYVAAAGNQNFDKMVGNGICLQIPWDTNPPALLKWANGQTGFPFIDAIMTQLRKEGWIHHLARHCVASFLTRGHLWISWEEGMKVFDELLLDADLVMNAGSWLWYSSSSFFQPFFHVLCPVRFGRKCDPNGDFIRSYLPVLRLYPCEFIHEPWKAPQHVQMQAHCVVGKDYPLPMVYHVTASKVNIERMRQVFSSLTNYRGSHIGNVVQDPNSTEHSQS